MNNAHFSYYVQIGILVCLTISGGGVRGADASPKTADDHYRVAVFKLNQGQAEEAVKLLEKGLKLNPEEGKIHFLLAQAYFQSGQDEACLEALRKAIQIDKSFRILAQNESAFAPLWEDKKFKLLIRIA